MNSTGSILGNVTCRSETIISSIVVMTISTKLAVASIGETIKHITKKNNNASRSISQSNSITIPSRDSYRIDWGYFIFVDAAFIFISTFSAEKSTANKRKLQPIKQILKCHHVPSEFYLKHYKIPLEFHWVY